MCVLLLFQVQATEKTQIGSLIMAGLDTPVLSEDFKSLVRDDHIGGVVLVGRFWNATRVAKITKELKSLRDTPLLIAIDQEGGRVSRVKDPKLDYPSAEHMAQNADYDELFHYGYAVGQQLAGLGIDINLAPVLDLRLEPRNKVIADRSFGSDPLIVSQFGRAYSKGLLKANVLPVQKHYPGHGRTILDSHYALPRLTLPYHLFEENDLIPFFDAISNNMPIIMTAHIVVSDVDERYPATLSRRHITDMLRNKYGFKGVVLSDDMSMNAITSRWSLQSACIRALNAGVDMLLVVESPERIKQLISHLEMAYVAGQINREEISKHFHRVKQLHAR
jgi:beta-N-acetylhexosaminidase